MEATRAEGRAKGGKRADDEQGRRGPGVAQTLEIPDSEKADREKGRQIIGDGAKRLRKSSGNKNDNGQINTNTPGLQ